jgi:hypothetical protein
MSSSLYNYWNQQGNSVGWGKMGSSRGLQRDVVYIGPWLTNCAFVQYMSPNAGRRGGVAGSQPMSSCTQEPK